MKRVFFIVPDSFGISPCGVPVAPKPPHDELRGDIRARAEETYMVPADGL